MMFERERPRNDDEARILPLINVVFLLLIFFMLAGRLSASDPFRVDPARSASEGLPDAAELLVIIGADGRLALDGDILDPDMLKAAVAERMSAGEDGAGAPQVRLKADARAEAVEVVEVMELLRDAGVARLDLLTVPAE